MCHFLQFSCPGFCGAFRGLNFWRGFRHFCTNIAQTSFSLQYRTKHFIIPTCISKWFRWELRHDRVSPYGWPPLILGVGIKQLRDRFSEYPTQCASPHGATKLFNKKKVIFDKVKPCMFQHERFKMRLQMRHGESKGFSLKLQSWTTESTQVD